MPLILEITGEHIQLVGAVQYLPLRATSLQPMVLETHMQQESDLPLVIGVNINLKNNETLYTWDSATASLKRIASMPSNSNKYPLNNCDGVRIKQA